LRNRNFRWVGALILGSVLIPAAARGQSGAATGATNAQAEGVYAGSVAAGTVSAQPVRLSLEEALDRGLKQNLGILLASDATGTARGQRWKELGNLLPNVSGEVGETARQVDLAAMGIKIPGVPTIIGPFGFFDARVYVNQHVVDFKSLEQVRSASQQQRSADYSLKDARELVVLVVGLNYLQAVAASTRVDTAQAQVDTAHALFQQAEDQLKAGVAAAIDGLRARVEQQTRQQQLIAAKNDWAKQKLALARAIGLPTGQEFVLTDQLTYRPPSVLTLEEALRRAYTSRQDYQSAVAQVRAAEYSHKAAAAGYLPTVSVNADYGDIGVNPSHSHGTFDATATLKIPIFEGNKVHGEVLQAEAALKQNQQQLENLRAQIEQDVRTAMLDEQSTAEQVEVARSNVDLAGQTLTQAKDRFVAGVTNNIEVVQAQEALASANESYISSLYSYNAAKISLARAIGFAEQGVRQYLKGN
jgi:outer membrane protein TolC